MAASDHSGEQCARTPASSRAVKQKRIQQRRYGFACSTCRRKKARCDGKYPACQKCCDSGEACTYDKRPSVAYAVSLQNQLQAYKDRFARLRQVSDKERTTLLGELLTAEGEFKNTISIAQSHHDRNGANRQQSRSDSEFEDASDGEQHEAPDEASLDPDGRLVFYGKTSLYHLGPQEDARYDPQTENIPDENGFVIPEPPAHSSSASHETPGYFAHDANDSLPQFISEIDASLLNHLLETYWCYPQHLHCVLCKSLFMRDLFISGPYVSPFLLSAVLTQAARYSTRPDAGEVGERFAKKALELLVEDIDRGSSIPTIQGLLIFSSRECACGRTSQGWLYSGMAFRMMRDLGLHVPIRRLGSLSRQFSREDLALRQQVFWSCYTWDKTMSLALGRAPIIHDHIELPTPETFLDGPEADDEIWIPVTGDASISQGFLQHRTMSITRFAAYCELCTIIDSILDHLYSRPHRSQNHLVTYLQTTLSKLEDWSSRLPQELLIKEDIKRMRCPPLHILLLNLLYHATTILLCRPYRKVSDKAKEQCTAAAGMIDMLFTLHVRRFGFRFITYLQSYTMFVACTINVLNLKENRNSTAETGSEDDPQMSVAQEASGRLDFGLEVLRQAGSTPSALRCAAIIAKLLEKKTGSGFRQYPLEQQPPSFHERTRRTSSVHSSQLDESPTRPRPCVNASTHLTSDMTLVNPSAMYHTLSDMRNQGNLPSETVAMDNANFGPGQTFPYQTETFLDSAAPLTGSTTLPYTGNSMQNSVGIIETPLRWLPDNLYDDGSWMLMDVDFENLPLVPMPP
ncbi:fungal-specific transcription factor domain-containing protein [Exophiala viscosa]|uniref:fungal-specific transcription factor domain-containing protein n=1 Tax=Exophiala viscosa TaxID=2486360 RepID=UPI002194EEEF|nr:fungal-specific transcription factor domain-containing protein [Exophiala viscosa]